MPKLSKGCHGADTGDIRDLIVETRWNILSDGV